MSEFNHHFEPFIITCYQASKDAEMFTKIINQGIDSHLEAFTKSQFYVKDARMQDARLWLNFHPDELPILIRRLEEFGTEQAETWANDIREHHDPA